MFLRVSDGVPGDIGKSIDLSERPEVLIGTGPGVQLQLTDPAWQQGRLRIERSGGVFRVTNEMGYTITVGGENLGDGEQAVWFGGVELQASDNTCLVLSSEAAPRAATDGVPAWIVWAAFAVGVLVLLTFVIPDEETGVTAQTADEARQEYTKLVTDLNELRSEPGNRTAAGVLSEIQNARLSEVRNQPDAAYRAYLAARDLLDRAPPATGPREKEVLVRARAFVNARLTALAPRIKQRK